MCVIYVHDNHHHHHHHSPTGVMEKYRDEPFRGQFNGVMRFKVDLTSQGSRWGTGDILHRCLDCQDNGPLSWCHPVGGMSPAAAPGRAGPL